MDKGSELSFIDKNLVDELQLEVKGKTYLCLKTFGSDTHQQNEHRVVEITLVDEEGNPYKFEVFDSAVITGNTRRPQLTEADWDYVDKNHITLTTLSNDETPKLLIGCDHLWEPVEGKRCRLPSGLHLIDTKFGCMVSGRMMNIPSVELERQITSLTQQEVVKFDKYWAIELGGPWPSQMLLTTMKLTEDLKRATVNGSFIDL
ncbi:unnamed protein product [Nippostrongylus brasiliensis]|uniref:DUF1758 domain-containing protein n=1 Tax=Nippostrongylus brasiliensis TaxID=27835 RepID=A0A0N4Y5S3_NIPBR|nr:unnamed protein product [Nippostrongylus brasiliensis]